MSLKKYLDDGRLSQHASSKEELRDLKALIDRNLKDASIEALSLDNRFGLAYEAALVLCKMALAHSGYRVKGMGAHQTSFEALEFLLGKKVSAYTAYFDRCRRLRNSISYDTADVVDKNDVEELLEKTNEFKKILQKLLT